jgi:hypothetical protein
LIALVILVFLVALGACAWGFIASCRLMFRGFRGILAPPLKNVALRANLKPARMFRDPKYQSGQPNSSRTTWPPARRAGSPMWRTAWPS